MVLDAPVERLAPSGELALALVLGPAEDVPAPVLAEEEVPEPVLAEEEVLVPVLAPVLAE